MKKNIILLSLLSVNLIHASTQQPLKPIDKIRASAVLYIPLYNVLPADEKPKCLGRLFEDVCNVDNQFEAYYAKFCTERGSQYPDAGLCFIDALDNYSNFRFEAQMRKDFPGRHK